MLDKFKQLGQLKKMRDQAMKIQKQLKKETLEVEKKGIKVVINGSQEIKSLTIDGQEKETLKKAINQAVKQSQQLAAKKLQEMGGGLGGMLKGA